MQAQGANSYSIKIPSDDVFANSESLSDQWDVEVTARYVADKMDFPQYEPLIKDSYIHGQAFISQHASLPLPGLDGIHPLHKIKFFSHATRLREAVLKRAATVEGKQAQYWAAADTAAWLMKSGNISKLVPILALRYNWCGTNLPTVLNDPSLNKKLSVLSTSDAAQLVQSIMACIEAHPVLKANPKAPLAKAPVQSLSSAPTPTQPLAVIVAASLPVPLARPARTVGMPIGPPVEVADELLPTESIPAQTAYLEETNAQLLAKISSLEHNLKVHAQDMDQLQAKAAALEEERLHSFAQSAQLQARSNAAQQRALFLKGSSIVATKELERISSLLEAQVAKDKQTILSKIDRLNADVVRARSEAAALLSADQAMAQQDRDVARYPAAAVDVRCSDDSDLDSVVDTIAIPTVSIAFNAAALEKTTESFPQKVITSLAPTSHIQPAPSVLSAGIGGVQNSEQNPLNLRSLLLKTVHVSVSVWTKLLETYRICSSEDNPCSVPSAVSDTRQVQLQVASAWLALGRKISAGACSEDGKDGLRNALNGIRCCSSLAVRKLSEKVGCAVAAEAIHNAFMLAVVQRLFAKFKDHEDQTQLAFLLAQVDAGELPFSEISRENLRDFICLHLHIDLPWDKFDSMVQKIDINKSGFIQVQELVTSFSNLAPLRDRLPSAVAQSTIQLLLSVCADNFMEHHVEARATSTSGSALSAAWMHFLQTNQNDYLSFQKYLRALQKGNEREQTNTHAASQLSLHSGHSFRQAVETKWVDDQVFVADTLFALSKNFVSDLSQVLLEAKIPSVGKGTLRRALLKFKDDAPYEYILKFILENHREACNLVAKGLNIYNSASLHEPNDILSIFSKFLVDFIELRLRIAQCMSHTSKHPETAISGGDTVELTVNLLAVRITAWETWLLSCLGNSYRPYNSESMNVELQRDWTIAQTMSVFTPCSIRMSKQYSVQHLPVFSGSLAVVEAALARILDNLRKQKEAQSRLYADAAALQEVQKQIHSSLWQSSQAVPQSRGALVSPHLVKTVNDHNNQQRLDQVRQVLEILNERAVKKKKVLETLVNQWKAAKAIVTSTVKPDPTAREGVLAQTKALQDRLLRDMQSKPTVKISQLENRVQLLMDALSSANADETEDTAALSAALTEVQALQQSLLQANNDAMRISSRIFQALLPS